MTIKSVTSWIYSFTYLLHAVLIPYLHVTYPQYSILVVLSGALLNGLDFMVSDSPHKNLNVINKNGYSNRVVIFYMTINLLIAHSLWIHAGHFLLKDIDIKYYFDLSMLLKIIITMSAGDIYFYFAHKVLHDSQYFAKLHVLHHCCYSPSHSTGFIGNPIDFILEFSGPNIMLIIAYHIFNKDAAFLIICGCIIVGWYSAEHDENIKLHHYDHHVNCNGDYPVYVKWRVYNPNDRVKKLMKR